MTKHLFAQYHLISDYLRNVNEVFPADLMETLEDTDPSYFAHIQQSKEEQIRIENMIINERQNKKQQEIFPSEQPQQMEFDFGASFASTCPLPAANTLQQDLKNSTSLASLPSIVSDGYKPTQKEKGAINWAHYENILKLFALGFLVKDKMTPQQQKDKDDLTNAIEEAGNARYKKKHLSAEEIVERDSKVYIQYGKNVIRAMAEPDPFVSARYLKDLRSEIYDTRNEYNADRLHKTMSKSGTIFMALSSRYKNK